MQEVSGYVQQGDNYLVLWCSLFSGGSSLGLAFGVGFSLTVCVRGEGETGNMEKRPMFADGKYI